MAANTLAFIAAWGISLLVALNPSPSDNPAPRFDGMKAEPVDLMVRAHTVRH